MTQKSLDNLRWFMLYCINTNVRIKHISHKDSRSCSPGCSRPLFMKSSEKSDILFRKPTHGFSLGIRITMSPILLIATSSPEKRHSFGNRTAWLLPFSNSFAVIMDSTSLQSMYISRYIPCQALQGFSLGSTTHAAELRGRATVHRY